MDIKIYQQNELAKIEIDSQIATAKQYPRDIQTIISQVRQLATINDEIAASCFYAKPVGQNKLNKKDKKNIINYDSDKLETDKIVVGESVRFAEIIANQWKNLRIRTYIKEETEKNVIAICEIHDLETNMAYSSECSRSILTSFGKQSATQIEVTKMAAQSIAKRNGIFSVIPKAYFIDTLEYIKKFSIGLTEKQNEQKKDVFESSKQKALNYFIKLGVTETQICNVLEIDSIESINDEHLIILRGFVTALKEKTETIDTIFNNVQEIENKNINIRTNENNNA